MSCQSHSLQATNLSQCLQEYDENNDGYISWQEFCAMAKEKEFTDCDRNEYWMQLGGEINNNNCKISVQQIIQSSARKTKVSDEYSNSATRHSFDDQFSNNSSMSPIVGNSTTERIYQSDDEKEYFISHRTTRSKTMSSFTEYLATRSPKTLLMNEPILLFRRYDMNNNGTLNITQFTSMVIEMYPFTNNNNEKSDVFEQQIKQTFLEIEKLNGNKGSFCYEENIYNLEEELSKFDGMLPQSQFLKLCIKVFGVANNENENMNENQNNELQMTDPIEIVNKIMNDFTENVRNKTKKQYQMAKLTVFGLYNWIEEIGMPAIKQNKELIKSNDELKLFKIENMKIQNTIPTLRDELHIKEKYNTEIELQKKNILLDLKHTQYELQNMTDKYNELYTIYNTLQTRYNLLEKKQNKLVENNDEIKKYIYDNQSLKQINVSLRNQINDLKKLEIEKEERFKEEIELRIKQETMTQVLTGNDYENEDENNLYDHDTSDEMDNRRKMSNESVKRRYKLSMYSNASIDDRLSQSDSEDNNTQYNSYNNTFYDELNDDINNMQSDTENEKGFQLEILLKQQTSEILNQILSPVIANNQNEKKKNDEMEKKYKQFYNKHEKIIESFNKENEIRDRQWKQCIGKLKKEIKLLNNKLIGKENELKKYKIEQTKSFKQIEQSVKEKESINKQIINNMKTEMNQILNGIKKEENNIKEIQQKEMDKNKQMRLLKEDLQCYKNYIIKVSEHL